MHGLIFETSVCYWQNQPGCYLYTTFHLCSKRSRQSLFFGIEILKKRTVLFYSDDFTNTDMIFNELAKIMINKQTLIRLFTCLLYLAESYCTPTEYGNFVMHQTPDCYIQRHSKDEYSAKKERDEWNQSTYNFSCLVVSVSMVSRFWFGTVPKRSICYALIDSGSLFFSVALLVYFYPKGLR